MTTLAEDAARLEARVRELETKIEHEKRRNDMQAGALRESRDQNESLTKKLAKAHERIATFESHFRTFHGSADHIAKQREEQAAQIEAAAPIVVPIAAGTLSNRIASLLKRNGEAA